MRNILVSLAPDVDFNELFKKLEDYHCVITFDNCGGNFKSIFSGNLHIVCRKEDYITIQTVLKNFV